MTGSAGRADRFTKVSSLYLRGGNARGCGPRGGLADDGKRLCDLDRARNVVFRLAPQDNLLHN